MYSKRNLIAALILTVLVLGACAIPVVLVQPQPAQQTDLAFASFAGMGMFEQDVYVETEDGQVQRITMEEAERYADAPVYAASTAQEHDLFALGETPFGPYEKGAALGFTMGEWLRTTGSGTYTVRGDSAEIDIRLQNLIPNGVYTIWCSFVSVPPNYGIVDEPCGAEDGSQNIVTADAAGNLDFQLALPTLPATTEETMVVIAANYHSDGQTYGAYPGDFGLNAHVQTMAVVPPPGDEAWRSRTTN